MTDNIRDRVKEMRRVRASDLIPHPSNYRLHPPAQRSALRGALAEIGFADVMLAWESPDGLQLIDGHLRRDEMGDQEVPVVVLDFTSQEEADKLLVTLDPLASMAQIEQDTLLKLLDGARFEDAGVNAMLEALTNGAYESLAPMPDLTEPVDGGERSAGSLSARFLVPPFSVLDARQGYWQERKRAWLALGIESELGRDANLLHLSDTILRDVPTVGGSSSFDPVLTEIAYRWFSPPTGSILDPFAGGSVRGIVAAYLGRQYTGIDLRLEQVTANQEQAHAIVPDNVPTWIVGDSRTAIPSGEYDLIFSCPPYYDLEQYSDDDADLSNASDYGSFILDYRQIIQTSVDLLRPDSFACFVVGDIRDGRGIYRNFVGDTVDAFQDAGASLYNEAILVTAVGSLPIRVGRQFEAGRKLGKTHQNVLIFYKGNPDRIRTRLGDVDVSEALSMFEADDV